MGKISVDVLMMTYNHESFIEQAIQGVLNQQTSFDVRLIIGNDCSTDATAEICEKYKKQFPEKILFINHERNLGHHKNFIEIYNQANARYIALCEGDDYWTDTQKLQKQVDLLENHPEYIICFHAINELSADGSVKRSNINQKQITDLSDLINGWYMNTATYIFRNERKIVFPEWFFEVRATDLCFHILIAERGGKIYFIDEVMAVYRRHEGGVTDEKSDYIYHLRKNIPFYNMLNRYLEERNNPYLHFGHEKINSIKNNLFYQLRGKKNKSFRDYLEIVQLAIELRKFNFLKLLNR